MAKEASLSSLVITATIQLVPAVDDRSESIAHHSMH
jgi:hypothetical protein